MLVLDRCLLSSSVVINSLDRVKIGILRKFLLRECLMPLLVQYGCFGLFSLDVIVLAPLHINFMRLPQNLRVIGNHIVVLLNTLLVHRNILFDRFFAI